MSEAGLTQARALSAFERSRRLAGYSPSTIRLEQRLLRAALRQLNRRSLRRVTREDLNAYVGARSERVCPTTLSREVGVLSAFFRFLAEERLVTANPCEGLKVKPGVARLPLLLSREAVGKLLEASLVLTQGQRSPEVRRARALRDRALLELLYGLGLRAAEAAAVRVSDLDLRSASLLVRRAKRGKPRLLPLTATLVTELERYLREGRPHLVKPGKGEGRLLLSERGAAFSGNDVLGIVKRVAKRAGVRAHPHALRRALATHLVQEGASLPLVRELLGHVRLDTTQRYVCVERDDLRRAVVKLEAWRSS